MVSKVKRVSVYLKAGRKAATSYYRFYQHFDKIDAEFTYHLMIPDKKWGVFFPIAIQPLWKKTFIFFYIYFRVLWSLVKDVVRKPDCIVISRCLINLVLPFSYRILLKIAKRRGVKIIFDFDDQIITAREVTTSVSDTVIVGSMLLQDLVRPQDKGKVNFLPTTDSDIYELVTEKIKVARLNSFDSVIRIVWVGTFSGLKYLNIILDAIECFGKYLHGMDKRLTFFVVCDEPLNYQPQYFILKNIRWDRQLAVKIMLNAHIGIMPLEDNVGTRGKCSFKLIQYLSAGLPCIGTNVGMNRIVLTNEVGIGLDFNQTEKWYNAFIKVVESKEKWLSYANNAIEQWKNEFHSDTNLKKWKTLLKIEP